MEYEDYLRWCAGHFEREGKVAYGMQVEDVAAGERNQDGQVLNWEVTARTQNGELIKRRAKHVVIAVGGRPVIPQNLQGLKHVAHSSQFASSIKQIQQREKGRQPRFVVLGNGQSAAEIYNDLTERFPESEVRLVIKGASLRPSDDSPFVNEVFDPDRVDGIYEQEASARAAALALDKGTNYGVVRLNLLEHLYDQLYLQRLQNPDPSTWRCQIMNNRVVRKAEPGTGSSILLKFGRTTATPNSPESEVEEIIETDYVFAATGYQRNAHEEMLGSVKDFLHAEDNKFKIARDYRIVMKEGGIEGGAGVWLQGCNEGTHGLSDTLLSILAVRSGELVESMFGDAASSSSTAAFQARMSKL
ncbi:putative L-ornithine 5-monooxygenase [Amylocarpus encephaloides]|uniref:L-ornithine N(5)-monooxygenase [NAD(P)H] n=1 Tax=Amylocarpus encephaloides TaxID=45428 RepID=A0A9P8C8U3_9HELO|nr:putative L-ornithine 5-monooxygenase [Amylocarpus encephaloides]